MDNKYCSTYEKSSSSKSNHIDIGKAKHHMYELIDREGTSIRHDDLSLEVITFYEFRRLPEPARLCATPAHQPAKPHLSLGVRR